MFASTCATIRESIYGILGTSQIGPGQVNVSNGTAFMISPGIIVTAAHQVHVESNVARPVHTVFELIRAPEIGQPMETATFIAEDVERDIALLRITNPRSTATIHFERNQVRIGTSCGSLGFPLAQVTFTGSRKNYTLTERFQGASVSAFYNSVLPSGRTLSFYETDSLMYTGSSGCPGFLATELVFGMHVASITTLPPGAANQNPNTNRMAISLWVPASDIVQFATQNRITIP